jgi:transposase
VVVPARPGQARDKAKVESTVLLAQRWILARLRNRTFFSLPELNAAILELLEQLNSRPMQKIGKSRRELFEALDRPALRPLPAARYELARWKLCRVNIDYHVEVERHSYSVPYQLVHEEVEARFTASVVEVYHKGHRVASHPRRFDHQPATLAEHMPSSHRAHAEWTPSRLIHWAEKCGPATGRVVAGILESRPHPEQGYRACLGLMRLGRRYGDERLDAACERAEYLRSYSYRTVKNILAAAQDRLPLGDDSAADEATPAHDNIRGAHYYAAAQEEQC